MQPKVGAGLGWVTNPEALYFVGEDRKLDNNGRQRTYDSSVCAFCRSLSQHLHKYAAYRGIIAQFSWFRDPYKDYVCDGYRWAKLQVDLRKVFWLCRPIFPSKLPTSNAKRWTEEGTLQTNKVWRTYWRAFKTVLSRIQICGSRRRDTWEYIHWVQVNKGSLRGSLNYSREATWGLLTSLQWCAGEEKVARVRLRVEPI